MATWVASTFGVGWGVAAGLAYGSSPFIVLEYASLSSRPPATVLVAAHLVSGWLWVDGRGSWWLAAAVVAMALLLYTHKLSVQLLWFLVPFLAVVQADVRWLLPLVAGYGLAAAVGPRFFRGMLSAHADIVRFWSQHWPWLGAHQVRDASHAGGAGFHRAGGGRLLLLHARRVLQYDPWLPTVIAFVGLEGVPSGFAGFLVAWVAGTVTWAALTLGVPVLRCLGEGTKYVKYAVPPSIALAAQAAAESPHPLTTAALLAGVVATLVLYAVVWRDLRSSAQQAGVADVDLDTMLDTVAQLDARVVCLPTHLADLVAYRTRRPVLWGTHNRWFRDVAPFFPVLRRPLDEFVVEYGLTHLLLDTRYAGPEEVGMSERATVASRGPFRLIDVAP